MSATMIGGTVAAVLWAAAWVVVAGFASQRLVEFPAVSAAVGAIVSGLISVAGCAVAWGGLKSRHRRTGVEEPPESIARRVAGWIAYVVWGGAAAAWNFGVFYWLIRSARDGHGGIITILALWSLIGWVLLQILFIGLGSIIDAAVGLVRQ